MSQLRLNAYVYEACQRENIKYPDIPVEEVEFYGQCGEDLIVRSLIRAAALRFRVNLNELAYIEIGGNHPFATSATYLLSKTLGMRGVIVEANKSLIENLQRCRPNDEIIYGAVQDKNVDHVMFSISNQSELSSLDRSFVLNWAGGRVGEAKCEDVPAIRINDIFRDYIKNRIVAYLSIDVEGMDLVLLKDMDFEAYRPWIVQAEPSDHHIPGNSQNIIAFMTTVGYRLIAQTNVNLIFGDKECDLAG